MRLLFTLLSLLSFQATANADGFITGLSCTLKQYSTMSMAGSEGDWALENKAFSVKGGEFTLGFFYKSKALVIEQGNFKGVRRHEINTRLAGQSDKYYVGFDRDESGYIQGGSVINRNTEYKRLRITGYSVNSSNETGNLLVKAFVKDGNFYINGMSTTMTSQESTQTNFICSATEQQWKQMITTLADKIEDTVELRKE